MTNVVWVIGSGGLLGRAMVSAINSREAWLLVDSPSLNWADSAMLDSQVRSGMKRLIDTALAHDSDWSIVWAAGAAVTSSTPQTLDEELTQLNRILAVMDGCLSDNAPRGVFFYASSAGGVYGGSSTPPFSEETPTIAISPYGRFKLSAELAVAEFAAHNGVSGIVGRIANLYGPGQKLEKTQGLISQIAKAQFSATPASIYVSLDTMRDYIFVADCAELICDVIDRAIAQSKLHGPRTVTKILASGMGVTIAALLGHFRSLNKGNPHVMLGNSAHSSLQAHDLRLRSRVWPDLDHRSLTPLPAGIHATMLDILGRIQRSTSVG